MLRSFSGQVYGASTLTKEQLRAGHYYHVYNRGVNRTPITHKQLAAYLFPMMYTYLGTHQPALTDDERVAISQEIVQATLARLSHDDFALVAKFPGRGSFCGWAVQMMIGVMRERSEQ